MFILFLLLEKGWKLTPCSSSLERALLKNIPPPSTGLRYRWTSTLLSGVWKVHWANILGYTFFSDEAWNLSFVRLQAFIPECGLLLLFLNTRYKKSIGNYNWKLRRTAENGGELWWAEHRKDDHCWYRRWLIKQASKEEQTKQRVGVGGHEKKAKVD